MLACRIDVCGEAHIGVICIVSRLILHTSFTRLPSQTVLIVLHHVHPPVERLHHRTLAVHLPAKQGVSYLTSKVYKSVLPRCGAYLAVLGGCVFVYGQINQAVWVVKLKIQGLETCLLSCSALDPLLCCGSRHALSG